uniref:Diacylglycerol kinase n=2 Tax=Clastoptera arizonana TaxID=38151 RepID=A0A1B6C2W1_9HEMI
MWSIEWNDGFGLLYTLLITITIIVLCMKIFKYFSSNLHIPIRNFTSHNWKNICLLNKSCYCNKCEELLIDDAFCCDCCGVCAHTTCIKTVNKLQKCKSITTFDKGPMKHHWVKGILEVSLHCEVCEEECGIDSAAKDLKCCWCHRNVHATCQLKLGEICDFGKFRSLIVPPSSVQLIKKKPGISQKYLITKVVPPSWPNWSPLVVIANCKSGNKDGDVILSCFRHLLNPVQVIDLSERPPEAALEWCHLLSPIAPYILVAGGDGTIGWVLSTIQKMKLDPVPSVAVVPLGTGNDLSRVLGWGSEYSTSTSGPAIMEMIQRAKVVPLDRWKLDINTQSTIYRPQHHHALHMYNYVSIGVDAQVTLDFHKTRESKFYIFSSRIFNKLLYLCFGTQQVVGRECQGLENYIEVFLDGKEVELPEIESVVILNIPSWGAGVNLWPMCSVEGDREENISDGYLEVVAIHSSFHIAQLQVGLSQPHRLGQASHVKIKLKDKSAMQVDGEPWVQLPGEINISHVNQAALLKLD